MSYFRILLYTTQAVALAGHYLLYVTVTRIYGITGWRAKAALAVTLALLSVSFLASSFLAHAYDNPATRAYYLIGGAWLGTFFHLLIASIFCWLVIGGAKLSGASVSRPIVATALFGLALLWSVYGIYNAYHPRVTQVRVNIAGLPDNWKGRSIVQISDVHLGHAYRAEYMQKLMDMANALHPDMVVITGDLFDGMDGSVAELAKPLSSLNAPSGVWFVTGNHENHLGVDSAVAALDGTGVTVMDDEVRDVDGLQLVGISYPRRGTRKITGQLMMTLPGYSPGKPTVLLYHAPVSIDKAAAAGVGLQLSGHTHKGQMFPFGYVTRKIYEGYDYGLHSIGGYSIYTTDGAGACGIPMRTGNSPEIVKLVLDAKSR